MNESPTYQELLAANRRLVVENEHLLKENAKLSDIYLFGEKNNVV